jgi:hypothetical protein
VKLDIDKANELLNKSGIARSDPAQFNTSILLKELDGARFRHDYTGSDDLQEEIDDVVDAIIFEMKDLDFCLVDDKDHWAGECITLCVRVRHHGQYDQHIEIDGVTTKDATDKWDTSCEQTYEYRGSKDIATFRAEFETLGATYSTELEGYMV